jgi:hypothetical protein
MVVAMVVAEVLEPQAARTAALVAVVSFQIPLEAVIPLQLHRLKEITVEQVPLILLLVLAVAVEQVQSVSLEQLQKAGMVEPEPHHQ